MNNKVQPQRPYRHFKGKLYYVHSIAIDTETRKEMVVFQTLYAPYEMFVREREIFAEKVEEGREDNVTGQIYRFELYDGNNV